jgi:hypothetical protein
MPRFHPLRAAAALALSTAALAAGPEQIHLSYTGKLGQLSVDFVCAAGGGAGSVGFTVDGKKTWATANASFITYASIGDMQQALIAPAWAPAPGAALSYYCACADGSKSDVFAVTPVPARYPSEVHVVFGDFGLVNDVSMASLIADATNGAYDSILHVGDFAYNFEDSQSAVGSQFMNDIQDYSAIRPVMPVAGNHVSATSTQPSPSPRTRTLTASAQRIHVPDPHKQFRLVPLHRSRAIRAPAPTRCRCLPTTSPNTARASTP